MTDKATSPKAKIPPQSAASVCKTCGKAIDPDDDLIGVDVCSCRYPLPKTAASKAASARTPAKVKASPVQKTLPVQRVEPTGTTPAERLADPELSRTDLLFTDSMLTNRVVEHALTGEWLWCGALGWLRWTGKVWARKAEEVLAGVVKEYLTDYLKTLVNNPAVVGNATAWREARTLLGRAKIGSVGALARGHLEADAGEFDQAHDFLNTPSGIVDLRTSEILPHDPGFMFTKITRVPYVPGFTSPAWDKAMECLPDLEVRAYMQIRYGQGITGHIPPDDKFVFSQGDGENGKTTLITPLMRSLGKEDGTGYAALLDDRVLLGDNSGHSTEKMALRGARIGYVEELPEGRHLNVAQLKKTVGTPTMTARYMRQDEIKWECTHSLFGNTNYTPIVNESDRGTWRRLELIPFPMTYRKPGEPLTGPNDVTGDPAVRQQALSLDGQTAALAWLVEGARRFYEMEQAMPPAPPAVVEATREWRMRTDFVMRYWEERIIPAEGRGVVHTELVGDFNDWLKGQGNTAWSAQTFATRFGSHEVTKKARVGTGPKSLRKSTADPSRPVPVASPAYNMDAYEAPLGAVYRGWPGIRFRTSSEMAGTAPDAVADPDLDAALKMLADGLNS